MYFLAFLYLIALLFVGKKFNKPTRFFLAAFPLILISWLRFGVGADYFSYKHIYLELQFETVQSVLTSVKNIEPLFKYIMFIFVKLGFSYHVFVSIFSSFLVIATLKFIENNSTDFEMSVLLHYALLYFYWNLSALRQGLVLAVMLCIFFNPNKKQSNRTLIIATVLMSLVHVTALIVPVIYFIAKMKWTLKGFLVFLALSPISRLFTLDFVISFIAKIPLIGKVASYMQYDLIKYFSLPSFQRLFFIFMILFCYKELTEKYKNQEKLINFALVGLIGYFYIPLAMVVGTRTTIFSYMMLIITLPMIFTLYDNYKIKLMGTGLVLLISTFSFANEFLKLADRTGYLKSPLLLNFETIFNGSYSDFDKSTIFNISILEDSYTRNYSKSLKDRVSSKEYPTEVYFNDTDAYVSVKFNNGYYGVINQEGKILLAPKFPKAPLIVSDYVQVTSFVGPVEHTYFRKLPRSESEVEYYENNMFSFKEVEAIIGKEVYSNAISTLGKIDNHEYSLLTIRNDLFTKDYNPISVKVAYEFNFEGREDYSYLRLMTSSTEFYIVMKDGDPLVERIYNEIVPADYQSFVIGYTRYAKEYISPDGQVVWFEPLK